MTKTEMYLGDGLYACHDGFHICLKTNGDRGPMEVFLDPEVMDTFMRFIEKSCDVTIRVTPNGGVEE